MTNLTNRYVASVKPPSHKRYARIWDDKIKGFGLRVTASGVKSFIYESRLPGSKKPKQVLIGRAEEVSAERARKRAAQLAQEFRSGEFERQLRSSQQSVTMREAATRYIEIGLREKSLEHVKNVRRHLISEFSLLHGDTYVHDLNRAQVMQFINDVKARVSTKASLPRFRSLTAFLNYLVNEGLLDSSPLAGVKPPSPPPSRDRVLSIQEIRDIWAATAILGDTWKGFFRVLILTGQRRSEVAGLVRSEIEGNWWTIPSRRTKNGQPNKVFFTPIMKKYLPEPNDETGLYFTHTGTTPVSGFSNVLHRLRIEVGFSNWTIHDFRRSFSTHLHELGQPPHIIEACLNHVSGAKSGVAGIYNRAEYLAQREAAFAQWSSVFENV